MRFVLASQSPARLGVLRSAGFDPSVVVSGVDEDAVAASLTDPAPVELVRALAVAKAEAVYETLAGTHADMVIVGCDSMLSINGEMVGKPLTPEAARERWASMAGKTGELLTGHSIIRVENGERTKEASGTEGTTVRFGTPSQEEIEAYIASGEPLQVAGGFTLDGRGGWFIEGIDGDFSSVIGISLPLTRRLLTEVGVSVIDLWTRPAS
ncbi:Maf family protein [Amycolatopsis thailandensis]|uniref:Nucleoside triphosphate pyrophosphatase n=1 Tax=Amycolatopsis thailandensis TaxID=589330 RepID=A0A229S9C6_9PSEU|nr:nucleoside triphosphate pyrophosphatase [Amycolatopsis thailandensis]OXM55542.1 septum formation inhibitor Maf [Amycolatopsis thailandensis]